MRPRSPATIDDLFALSERDYYALPTETLDEIVFGIASGLYDVPLDELHVRWSDDYENAVAEYAQNPARFTERYRAALDEPIEVVYRDGKLWIDDGHHRFVTARELGHDTIPAEVEVKDNPTRALMRIREERGLYDPAHWLDRTRDRLRGAAYRTAADPRRDRAVREDVYGLVEAILDYLRELTVFSHTTGDDDEITSFVIDLEPIGVDFDLVFVPESRSDFYGLYQESRYGFETNRIFVAVPDEALRSVATFVDAITYGDQLDMESTLLHEIIHYLDTQRMADEAFIDPDKDYERYINSGPEFNARYHELAAALDADEDIGPEYWNDVHGFIQHALSLVEDLDLDFDALNETYRKKLLTRLYGYWEHATEEYRQLQEEDEAWSRAASVRTAAAKTIQDLEAEGYYVHLGDELPNKVAFVVWDTAARPRWVAQLFLYKDVPCGFWYVQSVVAKHGWGPLLYDIAMEYATQHGLGMVSDREEVSLAARRVWEYYLEQRPDVESRPLRDVVDEDEADCFFAPGTWEPHLLDYIHTKAPELLPRLEAEGLLRRGEEPRTASYRTAAPIKDLNDETIRTLQRDDWVRVYHGTRYPEDLINGVDATEPPKRRIYSPIGATPGLFVAPTVEEGEEWGRFVFQIVVPAKNLHGTRYGGEIGRTWSEEGRDYLRRKYPDSFRPELSDTLELRSAEPQALFLGMFGPDQIEAVYDRVDGETYTRDELAAALNLDAVPSWFDPTSTTTTPEDFFRAFAEAGRYDEEEIVEIFGAHFRDADDNFLLYLLTEGSGALNLQPKAARALLPKLHDFFRAQDERAASYRVALTPEQKELREQYKLQQPRPSNEGFDPWRYIQSDFDLFERFQQSVDFMSGGWEEAAYRIDAEYDRDDLLDMAEKRIDPAHRAAVMEAARDVAAAYETGDEEEIEAALRSLEVDKRSYEDERDRIADKIRTEKVDAQWHTNEEAASIALLDEIDDALEDKEALLDEPVEVWRVLLLPADQDPTEATNLGRYWTTQKNEAGPFLGMGKTFPSGARRWRLHARIDPDSIDRLGTLQATVTGVVHAFAADIHEVRAKRYAPVFLIDVERGKTGTSTFEGPVEVNDWRRA